MCIKRIFALMLISMLTAALIIPSAAVGSQTATENNNYIIEETAVIGCEGYALTVRGDGSFYLGGETDPEAILFGARAPEAEISFQDSYYPVTTHTYSFDGIDYKITQFVYGGDDGICVYSRMTATNLFDVAVTFPEVTGTAPITEVPSEIAPKKTVTVDYLIKASETADENAPQLADAQEESYDSAFELMKKSWDEYLSENLSVSGLSKKNSLALESYRKAIIYNAIGISRDPVLLVTASPENALTVLTQGDDLYASALALMKTGDTVVATGSLEKSQSAVNAIGFDGSTLPFLSLEENLGALLSLQSYSYILRTLAEADSSLAEKAEKADREAKALADMIADALKETDRSLSYDWESATCESTLALNAEEYSSASSLCLWYTKSAVFASGASKELISLAKDAMDHYPCISSPEGVILSLFTEREDGAIIIGRGAPLSLLAENKSITVDNIALLSGGNAALTVTVDKKNVEISLSGNISAPIQIEFPAFMGNIEYASVGFDSDSGVVTAPEGTTSVTVRLTESISTVEKDRASAAALESAIAKAYEKVVETPTTASKNEFDKALSRAEKARTSTRDEKDGATEALIEATDDLSPMIAGYTYTIPEANENVGSLTKSEIYQKFSLPTEGTVDTLFVKGEFSDGISAAVYTLRGDNYTTDELRAETYGEKADGGIIFDLDLEAEGGETYVLCIFSESGDVTLALEKSKSSTAHTYELGETIVYNGASLALSFTVKQADRSGLDTFYSACLETDVSGYTKESQKTLTKCMNEAKELLCSSSVTESRYKKTYDNLKNAYDGLDTYASEDKIEETPIVGVVLIGIVIILLAATLVSAIIARKRMSPDN